MPLARYGTDASPVYDPVEEFSALPEERANQILTDLIQRLESHPSDYASDLARQVRTMRGTLPTHRGRIPLSTIEMMAESDDQATREMGKALLDEI